MTSHPDSLDAQIMTSTQHCYRQLARAIVDPVFPLDDPAVLTSRRGNLRLVAPTHALTSMGARRAA